MQEIDFCRCASVPGSASKDSGSQMPSPVQSITADPRQHSRYWFRSTSEHMTKYMFILRPFMCLEMGSPL
jgi:hypothetical protein